MTKFGVVLGVVLAVLLIALLVFVGWCWWLGKRADARDGPIYKFNSLIPALLDSGAVSLLGYIWVRRAGITAILRRHEEGGHWRIQHEKGHFRGAVDYLVDAVRSMRAHGFGMITVDYHGKKLRYRAWYWRHPEEVLARKEELDDRYAFRALGTP